MQSKTSPKFPENNSAPQTFYHHPSNKPVNKVGVPGYHRPNPPPTYESEETKAKRILNRLSDAFDQPERRYVYF